MVVCEKCGKEAKDDAKFCKTCGTGIGRQSQEDKKKRVLGTEPSSRKTPMLVAAAVVVLVVGVFAFSSYGNRGKGGMMQSAGRTGGAPNAEYSTVSAENGEIRIPESSLEGQKANYYSYTGNGKTIKFFALKAEDGTIRVALDACSACYHAKLGYRQDGGVMVCNNCGMGFRSTDVGKVTGGCSPIPVEKKIANNMIVLKAAELEAGAKYF